MGYPQDTKDISKKYAKFLKGKKICIVGPAPHINGSGSGEEIDSYDIVVRLNKGYLLPKEYQQDIGESCDIIYQTCMPRDYMGITMPIEELKGSTKWICCSCPDKIHKHHIKDFIKYVDGRIGVHIMNKKKWDKYAIKLARSNSIVISPPTSGFSAIIDLLRYDIEEMYIVGMTFFQKRGKNNEVYYPGYPTNDPTHSRRKKSKHNYSKEMKVFKKIFAKDGRIKCDPILQKLIEG